MSTPVVVIGHILLIPSALGILFGALILIATASTSSQISPQIQREARAKLEAQRVPTPLVEDVVQERTIESSALIKLTAQQQQAVRDAQISMSAGKVGAGAGIVLAGGFSLLVIVMSFIGGLFGWLLVMKKRVLQCNHCGAVIAAS